MTTILILRTGQRLESPFVMTYHYVELLQGRGKWIYPDVGYVNYGHGNYREVFIGGGRTLYDGKRAKLIEELYFVPAFGPAARNRRYLWLFSNLQFRFTPKLAAEIVYWPCVPLSNSSRFQHVLEHSKFEYAPGNRWRVGVGYGGYKYGDSEWQHKPFVTTTLSTSAGAFEFWLQKMPGGAQVQLRYTVVHKHGD